MNELRTGYEQERLIKEKRERKRDRNCVWVCDKRNESLGKIAE